MQNNYDVIIVGGGPAGLACALELANSKYSVLLLDRKKILGDKPCGGGICEKEVAVKYEPSFVKIIKKQEIVLNNFSINFEHTIKRITFEREDLAFFQEKKLSNKVNIKIVKETNVLKISASEVVTNKGTFSYNYLVGADGASSLVRRYLKLPFAYCFGMYYKIWGEYDTFVSYYDIKRIKLGYIWEFPHKKYNNIGIYYHPKNLKAVDAKKILQEYLRNHNYNFEEKDFLASPINYDYRGYKFGNIFLIGDAGGFTSRMHGGGINNGIISGNEVAKLIMDAGYKPVELLQIINSRKKEDGMIDFAETLPNWLLGFLGRILILLYKIPYFEKVLPF